MPNSVQFIFYMRPDDTETAAATGRKLAVWAFLFFFVKGMLWLLVPAALVWGEGCFGPG